jgi:splicing suppressor protein 51
VCFVTGKPDNAMSEKTLGPCNVCSKESSSRCVRCKSVWYCSTDHQKQDWKEHKSKCATNEIYSDDQVQERFNTAQHRISENKPMSPQERYKLLSQKKICSYCAKVGTNTTFISCPGCNSVCYCCAEHQQKIAPKHEKSCKSLQFANSCYVMLQTLSNTFNPPYMCLALEGTYNHSNIIGGGWDCYLPARASLSMRDEYAKMGRVDPAWANIISSNDTYNDVAEALLTENLSFPLTILHSLHVLYDLGKNYDSFINDLPTLPHLGKTLTIHLLGAQEYTELMMSAKYKEITSCLPGVKTVELVLIGPDIRNMSHNNMLGNNLGVTCVSGLYHNAVEKLSNDLQSPKLAIAFNCGVADTPDTWAPTIEYLTQKHIPSSFTSYTEEEGRADAAVLSEHSKKALESKVNPFSSKKAIRDVISPFGAVFYSNHVITFMK